MKSGINISWAMTAVLAMGSAAVAGAQNVTVSPGRYTIVMMPGAAAQGTDSKVKDDLFAGTEVFEKNASDVTEITMDPDSLDMVKGRDGERAHNMVLNVVRTYSYDKPGMYNMADVDVFRNKLNTGDWHCSVHTRELKTGESTDICQKRRTDDLKETAIITVSPRSLTFIHTIKHASGPGASELGDLPLMSLGHLPMVAMMDPEQFADMQVQMQMQNLRGLDMTGLQKSLQDSLSNMKVHVDLKNFDFDKLKKDLKDLNSEKMQQQMKELNSDAMKKHLDDMQKSLDQLNTPEEQKKLNDAEPNPAAPKDIEPAPQP